MIKDAKWFTLKDIKTSEEVTFPVLLKDYLSDIIKGNYPTKILELDIGKQPE